MTTVFKFIGPIPSFLILCAIVLCTIVVLQTTAMLAAGLQDVQVDYTSHAESKHGPGIFKIRDCLDSNGPIQTWRNPDTGNYIEVCMFDMDTFGMRISGQIDGIFKEITGWIEDEVCISEIEEYLIRNGYMILP